MHWRLARHAGREAERSGAGRPAWRSGRLWRRGTVAEAAVWVLGVVVPAPALDQHPGLGQGVEDLPVQQLVTKLAVEAFIVSILPGAGLLDVQRRHNEPAEPFPASRGDELRPLIGADVRRRPSLDEQLGQRHQHIVACQPPGHHDGQALARELVDHRQHAQRPAVSKRGEEARLSVWAVTVLGRPGAGSFKPTLWSTLMTVRMLELPGGADPVNDWPRAIASRCRPSWQRPAAEAREVTS